VAATSSVSAAAIANVLSGVNFPKNKDELRDHAQKNMRDKEVVLLSRCPKCNR
jgi:hypothetical protein